MEQEEEEEEEEQQHPSINKNKTKKKPIIIRIISKRRTWVILFVSVYTLLLSLSWNVLKSVLKWHTLTSSSTSSPLPSLYASLVLGAVFGLLSAAAAAAVAVPATVLTWITVLVLLAFCGKPRRALVVEGKKMTVEILGFAARVLVREGNCVAAVCAVLGYFVLVRRSGEYT